MANNYSQACVAVEIPEGRLSEVQAWVEATAAKQTELLDSEKYEESDFDGVEVETCESLNVVYFSGEEEYVNTDSLSQQLQRFMKDFDIEGGVFFSWASWCSKARPDEFSGGGCVVTKDKMYWSNSWDAQEAAKKEGVTVV